MSRVGEVVEYGSMGIVLTIFLYVIFGFAPSLMVSLSIADTLVGWNGTITQNLHEYGLNPDDIAKYEDTPGSGIRTNKTSPDYDGLVFTVFCISLGILAGLQLALQANIRVAWGIIIPWWLLSIYPFLHWLSWFYPNDNNESLFPGVNWFPW